MISHYKIISSHEPEEILPLIEGSHYTPKRLELYEKEVTINSLRLTCFKEKGLTCVKCGIEAKSLYLVEELRNGYTKIPHSIQAFAINEDGQRVLMTIDHIVPKSKGGSRESLTNVQPMCSYCNTEKDNSIEYFDINNCKSEVT